MSGDLLFRNDCMYFASRPPAIRGTSVTLIYGEGHSFLFEISRDGKLQVRGTQFFVTSTRRSAPSSRFVVFSLKIDVLPNLLLPAGHAVQQNAADAQQPQIKKGVYDFLRITHTFIFHEV
jgi:hypothetical protein